MNKFVCGLKLVVLLCLYSNRVFSQIEPIPAYKAQLAFNLQDTKTYGITNLSLGRVGAMVGRYTEVSLELQYFNQVNRITDFKKSGFATDISYFISIYSHEKSKQHVFLGPLVSLGFRKERFSPVVVNTFDTTNSCLCFAAGPQLTFLWDLSSKISLNTSAYFETVTLGIQQTRVYNPALPVRNQRLELKPLTAISNKGLFLKVGVNYRI